MAATQRIAKSYKLPKDVADMLSRLVAARRLPETYVVVDLIVEAYERKWPSKPERVSLVDERRERQRRVKPWDATSRVVIHERGYYEIGAQVVDGQTVLGWMTEDTRPANHSFTLGDLSDFMKANMPPPPEARWVRPPPGFDGVDYDWTAHGSDDQEAIG